MPKTKSEALASTIIASMASMTACLAYCGSAAAQTDIGAVNVVHRENAKPKKHEKVAHAPAPKPAPHPTTTPPASSAHARPATTPTNAAARSAARPSAAAVVAPGAGQGGTPGLPISAPNAVGSNAPVGSAPYLAPSQAPLNSIEPTSIVSDKIIRDVIQPGADFNEIVKYTPGWASTSSNGLIGDTNKGGWRGFADGQYNVTFDGIPFGDENNPSHHSASYFPSGFVGTAVVDRGPGPASQAGYATYGGTLGLYSHDLSDKAGGSIQNSYGSYSTFVNIETLQTGRIKDTDARALFQYSHSNTSGAQQYGDLEQNGWLAKADKRFGDVEVTVFGNYSREHYRNVTSITWPQYLAGGSHYGAVGSDPTTQQYFGNNVSEKQTDMEYVNLKAEYAGVQFNNKAYTYSYWYPWWQRNAADQTVEGSTLRGVTASFKGPKLPFGDVLGYNQKNNYRAWGNLFDMKRDIAAGFASGQLRMGVWWEHGDNWRDQFYADYTTQGYLWAAAKTVAQYQNSFKLDLASHYQNVQPWVEYEWKPIDNVSITPGYKFISFTRDHDARINQTTLTPLYYSHTYRSGLPFLTVRYRATPEIAVYGQASRGFKVPDVAAYYVTNPDSNNVSAQTTTNFQLGAVYKDENLTADIDVYQITSNNYTYTLTNTDGSQNLINGGTARQRGFEVEATYRLASAANALMGKSGGNDLLRHVLNYTAIYGNGTISDSRFLQGQFSGLYMPSAPRYTWVAGLIYDDGTYFGSIIQKQVGDQWGTGGQQAWFSYWNISKSNPLGATNANLNYISPYASTDLSVGVRTDWFRPYGVVNKVEFRCGVSDLFDNRAITSIGSNPTGLYTLNNTKLTYSFQAGRLFFGGVTLNF